MHRSYPEEARLSEEEVNRRFAWALRQGNPCWLWPETRIHHWQAALGEIERVTRQILCHGHADEALRGNAQDVGIAAYTSGMGPLLGYWIAKGRMSAPPATASLLRQHYHHNRVRMERLAGHTSRLGAGLGAKGVTAILLKGLHTAFAGFPAPGTRPVSDIDLFVEPGDKAAAGEMLRALDYRPEAERKLPDQVFWRHASASALPQSLSLVHCEDPWGVDLHTSANRRYAAGARIIRFDALIRFSPPEPWPISPGLRVLPPPAAILFLACHAGSDFTSLRMLRLVELVLFIRQAAAQGRLSWAEIASLGEQSETLTSAFPALSLADRLAPGTVPESFLRACEREVPKAVVKMVEGLEPAHAHRVLRCALEERFIWTTSMRSRVRQLFAELFPARDSGSTAMFYKLRMWRLIRGRMSYRAQGKS